MADDDRTTTRPRRGCLTVPGSNARMIEKAAGVAVDMVILDLEDAVAPSEKESARDLLAAGLADQDWGSRTMAVRVNDWTSPWTLADLQAVVGVDRLDVVVLPKVEDAGMVRALDLVLTQLEASVDRGRIGVDAQIESAMGVGSLHEICRASERLEAITLGPLDLAASLGMPADAEHGRRRFDHIASAMVVAARAAGVQVIDGPYPQIRDLDGLRTDTAWAAELGFDGRWVLHPDQVEPVQAAFTPTDEAMAQAERVLAAYDEATAGDGRGAVLLDGEMIDEASARIARRVVAAGRAAARHENGSEEP